MKFVHGLLLGTGAAFGLGCAARFIYGKIIEAKIYKDYTKALEDFMTFKSDKKYIEYNKGLEEKYIGPGIVHVIKNKKDLTLISFKRWKNTEVGELIIRDFILLINEAGAKNGILVV